MLVSQSFGNCQGNVDKVFTRACSLCSGLAEVDESASTSIVVWRSRFYLLLEDALVLSLAQHSVPTEPHPPSHHRGL